MIDREVVYCFHHNRMEGWAIRMDEEADYAAERDYERSERRANLIQYGGAILVGATLAVLMEMVFGGRSLLDAIGYYAGVVLVLSPIVGARVLWQMRPRLRTCLLFWLVAGCYRIIGLPGLHNIAAEAVWLAQTFGFALNATVTLANGGFMPVYRHMVPLNQISVWTPGTVAHRLPLLADRFKFGTSIGDWFIFGSIIASIVVGFLPK